MSNSAMIATFKENCLYRLDEGCRMLDRCMKEYDDTTIWERPNASTNSVANHILHLQGNLGQYVLSSLGETPDTRKRDEEFNARGGIDKNELISGLKTVLDAVAGVIERATEKQLLKKRRVQGFELSGVGILLHAVEHFSYHIGQIALWTKIRTNADLGFYSGVNLNTLND